MKLPASAHASQPWRIHSLAPDFRLEDVWALPTPGGPADFPRLLELVTSLDPSRSSSTVTRALFALREKAGELLGWDDPSAGLGARVAALRDRLPPDLLGSAGGVVHAGLPFTPLYVTADEFAAEIANRTVHGVIHLGWVQDDDDGYRGQMAILVKRNGLLGDAYMAAITPFRHLVVYPQLLREIGEAWREQAAHQRPAPPP